MFPQRTPYSIIRTILLRKEYRDRDRDPDTGLGLSGKGLSMDPYGSSASTLRQGNLGSGIRTDV